MTRNRTRSKKHRRRRANVKQRPARRLPEVRLVSYEVSQEPMHDPAFDALPAETQERYQELHVEVQCRPAACVAELEALVSRHPEAPQFANLLYVAYTYTGQEDKAEAHILETLERHPDYLFARLGYAELCLRRGKPEEVAEIFDHTFELAVLYPNRKVFHFTEVVSFAGVMAQYFLAIGRGEVTEVYYKILRDLAPDHPRTRQVGLMMNPASFLRRMFPGLP